MAAVWVRGGVKLRIVDGKLQIEVDSAKLAAAPELQPLGKVAIYEIEIDEVLAAAKAESGRFLRRLRMWWAGRDGAK